MLSLKKVLEFANNLEYPVIVRPSYVLSGAAMGKPDPDQMNYRHYYKMPLTLAPSIQ